MKDSKVHLEASKRSAAHAAFQQISGNLDGKLVLGLGTGSTTNYFIDLIVECADGIAAAIASSSQTRNRLMRAGILATPLSEISRIDIYVDGADEVAPDNALIKGGGAALTGEKILASASAEFICIVDKTKLVSRLGQFPLPIEVIPMAAVTVSNKVSKLGGKCVLRKDARTDHGNLILDTHGLDLSDPDQMERQLNDIPGVVTNGIFAMNRPDHVLVGDDIGLLQRD